MKINLVDAFQIAAKPFFKKLLVLIRRHRITIQILNSYAYEIFYSFISRPLASFFPIFLLMTRLATWLQQPRDF